MTANRKKGKPKKDFIDYFKHDSKRKAKHVTFTDYSTSPGNAFLKYSREAKDAVEYFRNNVKKLKKHKIKFKQDDADASLELIVISFLPSLMGHFVTYQKHLFAGIFEMSIFLKSFDEKSFIKMLQDAKSSESTGNGSIKLDAISLCSYRNFQPEHSGLKSFVGLYLADNLPGWHDPIKVNNYFKAFGFSTDFFNNEDCKELKVLWQLRHSIVHTGGTLTRPDSQKVSTLRNLSGKTIVFEDNFIWIFARKIQQIIHTSSQRLETAFFNDLVSNVSSEETKRMKIFFEAKGITWNNNPKKKKVS
ncbi:MAG: hypothetical protein SFU25_01675 [Candidatus Caenarcaniphilales bacterium]|nr:hypothetical protein [Candidatus Caenarcaniphilales bacterium]